MNQQRIDKCPECLNTDLFRGDIMTVCKRCGNLLEEHLQFVENMPIKRDFNYFSNQKTEYDVNRIRNLLAKKEKQHQITFDADFIQQLNDYIGVFSKEFTEYQSRRKNFISIEHIIHRFCQNFGHEHLTKYFKLLKTKKIRDSADDIISEIDLICFKRK